MMLAGVRVAWRSRGGLRRFMRLLPPFIWSIAVIVYSKPDEIKAQDGHGTPIDCMRSL